MAFAVQEACMNYRVMKGIVLLLCVSFVGAEQQSAITGQIVDSEGAAIAKARVIVHWDSSGSTVGLADNIGIQQDVIVTTGADGRYSAGVPAGFYDVFVSAMAFTPTAAKVRVKQGQHTAHNSMLRADPLVSRELAH
jgi:Carboxypeptidase regulatory-like domain